MQDLRQVLGEMLADVWRQFIAVQGKKIRGRNLLDVFQHRLKVAACMPSIPRFLEKLAHGLGLQSLNVDARLLDIVMQREEEALDILRNETVYLTVLAYNLAKRKRGERA